MAQGLAPHTALGTKALACTPHPSGLPTLHPPQCLAPLGRAAGHHGLCSQAQFTEAGTAGNLLILLYKALMSNDSSVN